MTEYLSHLCRELSASNSTGIENLLTNIDIVRLVKSAVANLDHLQANSPLSRSFHHPGGALKVILYSNGRNQPELRFHIWRCGKHVKQENNLESIHDHKWGFFSRILCGHFRHAVFEESSNDGTLVSKYCFESPGDGTYRTLGPQACRIVLTADSMLHPGAQYFLKSAVLHSFVPTTDCYSATLFYRLPYESEQSVVLLDESKAKVIPDVSGPCLAAVSEVRGALSELVDMIESAPNEYNR